MDLPLGSPAPSGRDLFSGFAGLPSGAAAKSVDGSAHVDEVLAEFESLFINEWLKAARSAENVLFEDNPLRSQQTELQRDWLDAEMARRLSEQGHSYQTLVDEARRQLATRLLRQTDFSLIEVAFMTGFSEQSAFNRAFKRWAGQTPRSFRLQSQS